MRWQIVVYPANKAPFIQGELSNLKSFVLKKGRFLSKIFFFDKFD
jgi:hypothetical protein